MKVLCVDYDRNSLSVIKNVFELWGFCVTSCNSLNDVVNSLDEKMFDAVITEINLPGVAPGELVGMVRDRQNGVPIIVLTESHSIRSTIKAIRDGAYEVLRKPIVPDNLLSLILNAVGREMPACLAS